MFIGSALLFLAERGGVKYIELKSVEGRERVRMRDVENREEFK